MKKYGVIGLAVLSSLLMVMLLMGLTRGKSVRAQSEAPQNPCDFESITLAGDLDFVDPQPGEPLGRRVIFTGPSAQAELQIIATLSRTEGVVCHLWGDPAFEQTDPYVFDPLDADQDGAVLTYTVLPNKNYGAQTVVLTSSRFITGSMHAEYRDEVSLIFAQRQYVYLPLVLRAYDPFVNGSFEVLNGNGIPIGWKIADGSNLPVRVEDKVPETSGGDTDPIDGNKVMLLGERSYGCDGVPLGYAAIEQTFVVPDDARSLKFNYIIFSQDASVSGKYDRFEVRIQDEQGQKALVWADGNLHNTDLDCNQWWRVPSLEIAENRRSSEDGWAESIPPDSLPEQVDWDFEIIDLEPYRGQRITISFENHSRLDNWYNTYTYIDNVGIEE